MCLDMGLEFLSTNEFYRRIENNEPIKNGMAPVYDLEHGHCLLGIQKRYKQFCDMRVLLTADWNLSGRIGVDDPVKSYMIKNMVKKVPPKKINQAKEAKVVKSDVQKHNDNVKQKLRRGLLPNKFSCEFNQNENELAADYVFCKRTKIDYEPKLNITSKSAWQILSSLSKKKYPVFWAVVDNKMVDVYEAKFEQRRSYNSLGGKDSVIDDPIARQRELGNVIKGWTDITELAPTMNRHALALNECRDWNFDLRECDPLYVKTNVKKVLSHLDAAAFYLSLSEVDFNKGSWTTDNMTIYSRLMAMDRFMLPLIDMNKMTKKKRHQLNCPIDVTLTAPIYMDGHYV